MWVSLVKFLDTNVFSTLFSYPFSIWKNLYFFLLLLRYSVFKQHMRPKSRGGDEESRTPDPLLARQVLSQLSCTPIFDWETTSFKKMWWAEVDSNHRPHAYQACALTCWAISPYFVFSNIVWCLKSKQCEKSFWWILRFNRPIGTLEHIFHYRAELYHSLSST